MEHPTAAPAASPASTTPPLSRAECDMLALADALGVNLTPLAAGS